MRRDKVIFLFSKYHIGDNEIGDAIKTPEDPRRLLAEKNSVRQSEFYQAQANGFKPELVFTIWLHEYKDEAFLIFNEKSYKIIRTFEKNSKEIELVCEGLINNGPIT